jgi:hypothetical protein
MGRSEYITYLRQFNQITSQEFVKALKSFGVKARTEQLSTPVTESLQMFDIITQGLQHLIETHEKVMTLYVDDIFKESFLHLQYFQFSIIAFDLFKVMSFVDLNLSDGPDHTILPSASINTLAALTEKIKQSLKTNGGDLQLIGLPLLTSRQVAICEQLYTMESERIVLDWYVRNSGGEFSDLLKVYQSWLADNNGQTIELFENV